MDFSKNFQSLFMVDITPDAAPTYVRLAKGISSVTPATNDDTDDTAYLDGDGGKDTEVTGMQMQYDFSGHRADTDAAQNYIAGLALEVGDARRTHFKAYHRDGSGASGDCTITTIVDGGGDANAKGEFSCSVMMNGKPTKIVKTVADVMTVVIAAGTTTGTTTATFTSADGWSEYYSLTSTAETAYANAYKDPQSLTSLTSGAEIAAEVGQYLNMWTIDLYKRVVSFVSHELVTADIAS
jgi:hypothetical protein